MVPLHQHLASNAVPSTMQQRSRCVWVWCVGVDDVNVVQAAIFNDKIPRCKHKHCYVSPTMCCRGVASCCRGVACATGV